MKKLRFLRDCVSLVVALLICLSLFSTQALAFEQSVVEQSKNNYDLTKSSTNNTKVSPDVLKTPHSPPPSQKSILYPGLKANSFVSCEICDCDLKDDKAGNNFCSTCCQRNRDNVLDR
jgi:hypothetical protein